MRFTHPRALRFSLTAAAAMTALLTACTGPTELIEIERSNETTASGVQTHDLVLGIGKVVQAGDFVTVDYIARLTDRTVLDSTYDRGKPVRFQVGAAPVEGWNEGLAGMRVGGKRSLVIPAHLAFGEEGIPGRVPPGATLVYEMELLSAQGE